MGTPFENSNLSFLTTSPIEDGQLYFEQPNMFQVEDIKDFSQPIFVEINPLISMEEDIEGYMDALTWTESSYISGTTVISKDGDASLLNPGGVHHLVDHLNDRGHGKVPVPVAARDGPSYTSDLTTINPVLLDISRRGSSTDPDKIQRRTEEPERFLHSTISVPQQAEATLVKFEHFDSAAASKQDNSDISLEKYLSEMLLEQHEATAKPDTDSFGKDGDPIMRTHLEQQNQMLIALQHIDAKQDDATHTVSLGEPATVVPQPELRGDHDAVNPLVHVENKDPLGDEVPPQVTAVLLESEPEHAPAQERNTEVSIEHSNSTSTNVVPADLFCSQEPTISTPAFSPATQDAHPIKRRRMMFNAVAVPALSSITKGKYMNPKIQADDNLKALDLTKSKEMAKHLKNPKVKNDRTTKLSADTVRRRLRQIGLDPFPIALPKSLMDATFQRDMISHYYGGNIHATFPKIRRDMVAAHGLDDFMYINLQHNPHAPQVPGAPGLWYTVGRERSISRAYPWTKEQRVISRLAMGIWQYQGQYALIPADSLTKEEWGAQDVKVRNAWAQEIHVRLWGRPTRARIALRARLGRLPTQAELAAALDATSKYSEVTSAQIAGALLDGEETMAVWAMKCVGYDENFQKGLIEKQKTWVPPKKAKNGAGERTEMNKAAAKAGISRKRKAEALDSGNVPDECLLDSDDGEIQVVSRIKRLAMQRRPRHTK